MISAIRNVLRDIRYALPAALGKIVSGPGAERAARICEILHQQGLSATVGYFPGHEETPENVLGANKAVATSLFGRTSDVALAVKAPHLAFDREQVAQIAASAATSRLPLIFDAHAPQHADATLALVEATLADCPGTGFAMPGRWRRSLCDAERFRDTSARIRIVKGEWADRESPEDDIDKHYLELASRLAGRSGMVAVATHDPTLAARALDILLAAGTPCELELIRGLPKRKPLAVARQRGVKSRIYVPFGEGWVPYAVDKALARPYLLSWMINDRWGSAAR